MEYNYVCIWPGGKSQLVEDMNNVVACKEEGAILFYKLAEEIEDVPYFTVTYSARRHELYIFHLDGSLGATLDSEQLPGDIQGMDNEHLYRWVLENCNDILIDRELL